MEHAVETYSRVPVEAALWHDFARRHLLPAGDFADPEAYRGLAERLEQIDAARGTRGNRLFYLATPAVRLRRDRRRPWARPASPGRVAGLGAHRRREAVRPRPRLGARAQRRGDARLRRGAGLPHRPLPGQGDRPQPDGLPLRQRHLRAALEPPLRRPRADHRGRGPRRRGPRRSSTRRPARAATSSRTTCCSCSAWWPWSRPSPSRRTRCATRRCACCAPSIPTGASSACARNVVRGQYTAGLGRRRPQVPGYREEQEVAPTSTTETFVALKLEVQNWRWADVPFYLRTGKRLPKRARRRSPIQFKRPPLMLFREAATRARAEPAGAAHPARRGHHAALRGQGARARPRRAQREHGLHLRLVLHARGARGLRDAAPRRDARRRLAVHARRRGRGGVGHRHAARRDLGGLGSALATTSDLARYEAGTWGPEAADQLLERDGRRWRRL